MTRLTKEDERKKFALMSQLHLTEAEALDVIEADKEIDRGEKMEFDLPPDKEKVAKEYAKISAKKEKKTPTVYKFDKRERKKNATKQGIIEELAKFLTEQSDIAYENVVVTNAERQIAFSIGEDNFELTLVQKRKPK